MLALTVDSEQPRVCSLPPGSRGWAALSEETGHSYRRISLGRSPRRNLDLNLQIRYARQFLVFSSSFFSSVEPDGVEALSREQEHGCLSWPGQREHSSLPRMFRSRLLRKRAAEPELANIAGHLVIGTVVIHPRFKKSVIALLYACGE